MKIGFSSSFLVPKNSFLPVEISRRSGYPLGLWINGWPAGFVTAHVVWILLEETWVGRLDFCFGSFGPNRSILRRKMLRFKGLEEVDVPETQRG